MIGTVISPFGMFRPRASFSAEALALFSKWDALGTPASDSRKILVDNTIVALKAANLWNSLDFLYVWTAHSQTASLVDWKNPSTRLATANGNLTFTTDSHWAGGTTGRMALGYNPGDGGTYKFLQDNNSFGCYFKDHTNETKVNLSAQSAGSIGIDLQSVITTFAITTKNNSGTGRGVANFTNRGLSSCQRTASNSWQNRKNGYDLYNNGGYESDASSAVLNLEWMGFCRNINSAYTVFSTAKQMYCFAGESMNLFTLNYLIEKNFLNPLTLIPKKRLTLNGNSFTSTGTYVKQLMIDLGSYDNFEFQARGISGKTTVELQTDAVTTIFPMTKTFLTKNVYFFWELTNDMAGNSSNATTCYNNLVAYCSALRTAQPGCKIIVATMLPRSSASITNANRQNDLNLTDDATLNGKIRNHLVQDGYADALADVASDATWGIYSNGVPGIGEKDTTMYSGDEIHPTTTGYNYWSTNYISPAITPFL